jgi:hypothetical protein
MRSSTFQEKRLPKIPRSGPRGVGGLPQLVVWIFFLGRGNVFRGDGPNPEIDNGCDPKLIIVAHNN